MAVRETYKTQWIEEGTESGQASDVDMMDISYTDGKEDEQEKPRDSMDTIDMDFLPIQQYSRPATPEEIAFERDVLSLGNGKTEEELNSHYKSVAEDLGIEAQRKRSRGSVYGSDVPDTAMTIASSVRNSLSQTSYSTPPTSCDSSERQTSRAHGQKQPDPAPFVPRHPSRLSSRPPSVLSSKSISSSIKSGWKRLSGLSKKRTSTIPTAESSSSVYSLAPETRNGSVVSSRPRTSRRPSTGHSTVTAISSTSRAPSITPSFSTYHNNVPSMMSPQSSRPPSLSRGKSLPSISSEQSFSPTKNFSVPFLTPPIPPIPPRSRSSDTRITHSAHTRPLSPTREEDYSHAAELKAAQARTARNRDLQRLKSSQTAEQRRFLSFQASQMARVTIKHQDRVRMHMKVWSIKEREMEDRHAARETEVEARQLNAELELERELEAEKRTVEARLRHMEGYVSGRPVYEEPLSPTKLNALMSQFPKREISTHAIQMLNQQRHLKRNLPQLHNARINVLREQQTKKLEKLQDKQATEWDCLMAEKEEAEDELREKQSQEELVLKTDFDKRKDRMEWRWKVAEEMEIKRLQDERGVMFAPLKTVRWSSNAWKGVSIDL